MLTSLDLHVAKGFVIPLAVVIVDEAGDLPLKSHRRLPDLQQHPLLAGAMVSFDLVVGLWLIRAGQDVAQAVGFGCSTRSRRTWKGRTEEA